MLKVFSEEGLTIPGLVHSACTLLSAEELQGFENFLATSALSSVDPSGAEGMKVFLLLKDMILVPGNAGATLENLWVFLQTIETDMKGILKTFKIAQNLSMIHISAMMHMLKSLLPFVRKYFFV